MNLIESMDKLTSSLKDEGLLKEIASINNDIVFRIKNTTQFGMTYIWRIGINSMELVLLDRSDHTNKRITEFYDKFKAKDRLFLIGCSNYNKGTITPISREQMLQKVVTTGLPSNFKPARLMLKEELDIIMPGFAESVVTNLIPVVEGLKVIVRATPNTSLGKIIVEIAPYGCEPLSFCCLSLDKSNIKTTHYWLLTTEGGGYGKTKEVSSDHWTKCKRRLN